MVADTAPMLLQCGSRHLDLGQTRIMGVLNITPDSFSDGGRLFAGQRALLGAVVETAEAMIDAGVDILDVGGESTRPGSQPISVEQECARVLPVIEALVPLGALVSLDTSKPSVAAAGISLGCHIINDVRGLTDPAMVTAVARSEVGVCVMHMLGEPTSMQLRPSYGNVVNDVRDFFARQVQTCREAGISTGRLLLDPGFGFGKTLAHNLALLRDLPALRVNGLPILVGLSRKGLLGKITGRDVGARLVASAVAAAMAVERGANVVRVHDVESTRDALRIVQAVVDLQG
jgi:dihydropteroate synthase